MNDSEKQKKFLELFEPCKDGLVRFSKAMTRDSEKTKDLVQETILRAYHKFDSIKSPVAFKSFLFSIASRIYKRQVWRSRFFSNFKSEDEYDYEMESLASKEPAPDRNFDIDALRIALSKLPEKQREAVVLFEIIGLSVNEIQEIQGGSSSGVKSRIQRGRKELAFLLGVDKNGRELNEYENLVFPEHNRYGYSLITNNVYL